MCDWNNDDSLDIIAGERDGHLTFFRRTGDGTLTNAGRIQSNGTDIITSSNSWPRVCDWNNDGRKDLLVGQEGLSTPCNVYVYLNQGTDAAPVFGDSTPVLHGGVNFADRRTAPAALDLDNDGNKDLVLGEWYSSVRLYHNTGPDSAPVFSSYVNLVAPDSSTYLNGNPPRFCFADWDGDGDLDMISCDYYGSVFLRSNVPPTAVGESGSARAASGLLVFPNPATGAACIEYSVARPGPVTFAIYGSTGTLVRTLPASGKAHQASRVIWDCRDLSGRAVPAGAYWCRLVTPEGSSAVRITVAR